MRDTLKNERGFSMVELVAVMVVMGILAAYAVPKFMNLTEDAKTSAAKAALASGVSMAQHEVMTFMMRNAGKIPSDNDLSGLRSAHDLGDYVVGFKVNGDDIHIYSCEDGTQLCNGDTAYNGRKPDGSHGPVFKVLSIRELAGYER